MGYTLGITAAEFAVMLGLLMGAIAPIMVWVERRACAMIQDRPGPNRLGPFGLLQPLADVFKFIFKEDVTPAAADKPLYLMAPALALLPALTTFVVIPFAPPSEFDGHPVDFTVAGNEAGVLLFLALASLGVYSLVVAGYASNNKFSLLGSIRASAQMISYELALTLSVVAVLLPVGSLQPPGRGRLAARARLDGGAPGDRLPGLPGRLVRRDQPAAVRPARGRVGAGRRLPHRVQRHALRRLLHGRVRRLATLSALGATLYFGGWSIPFVEPPTEWLGGGALRHRRPVQPR